MFVKFQKAVQTHFKTIQANDLFTVKLEKDELWKFYLSKYPEGSNPLFRECSTHDCQSCKKFVRDMGGTIAVIDGKKVSIWDVVVDAPSNPEYQIVADAMSEYVKTKPIENRFLHYECLVGCKDNIEVLDSGEKIIWEHFNLNIPIKHQITKSDLGGRLSRIKSTTTVFKRALKEITVESIKTVLELMEPEEGYHQLYRGLEHKFVVDKFLKYKMMFDKITTDKDKDIFCWTVSQNLVRAITNIRTNVIGTLLIHLSEGRDLVSAVKSFEEKMEGYKTPTALLITKSMSDNAKKEIEELGYTPTLDRRFAVPEDITINNVLFANRSAKKVMDVFDEMVTDIPKASHKSDTIERVNIQTFLDTIIQNETIESVEILVENSHEKNFVSLIAPDYIDSKIMFKWLNNFSWNYKGNVVDSIKERVKEMGGKVDGDWNNRLAWFNLDDLDAHMTEPDGFHITFDNRRSNSGFLDIDMNASTRDSTRESVENICYPDRRRMKEGVYEYRVHNYCKRESIDVGFECEIEFDGKIHTFVYDKAVGDGKYITVAKIHYSHANGFKIIESLPSTIRSKEIWGITTNKFQNVSMIMNSPNFWDEKEIGNKHWFFMIENCNNPDQARGFYNEFLKDELKDHRKVFEVLGSKMKTPKSDNQLSGVGFSSTQRNEVLCRVKGSYNRTIKLTF